MKHLKFVCFVLALLLLSVSGLWAAAPRSSDFQKHLRYAPAPIDNPLIGFMPFSNAKGYATDFPHSMEYADFSLRKLMPGPNSYAFDTEFEPVLQRIASRGCQAVLRVYVDFPNRPTGIPQFLLDAGLKTRHYKEHGGGDSPDYSDERLISSIERFLAEFGKRYDGDPRIGFITVGLLGMWGEWHTWPHSDWFASEEVQNRVLRAYTAAFPHTWLVMRGPYADGPRLNVGYHDDSFAFATLPEVDWHFLGMLRSAGVTDAWKTKPIGGEMYPPLQEFLLNGNNPDKYVLEDFGECAKRAHCSWLIYDLIFNSSRNKSEIANAEKLCRQIGYEFYVSDVRVPVVRAKGKLSVEVTIENRRVAPFYYDWPMELRLRDSAGRDRAKWTADWSPTKILPGQPVTRTFTLDKPGLAAGRYNLSMRVVNPMPNGKPLCFANAEQAKDGWLNLGAFTVR